MMTVLIMRYTNNMPNSSENRCLVVPGIFLPYNDTVTQLVYKQLRLLPFEFDVCALSGPTEDPELKTLLQNDPCYAQFHCRYVGKYQDVLFSIDNINLFKGLANMQRYINSAVKSFNGQKLLYTSSFPCYTTRVGVILKQKYPELIWIANFSDPINHSPYKYDKDTYSEYSLLQKVAFKLYCHYYVVDKDEANAFEHADLLVFICEEQRDYMLEQYMKYYGAVTKETILKKSVIVPLNYIPEWNLVSRSEQGITGQHQSCFVLSHFGRVYGLRKIEEFIYACAAFRDKHPDIQFLVQQYGEFRQKDILLIKQLNMMDYFQINKKIPYRNCIQKMNESNAVILFDTILPDNQIQPYLPSKIIEYSLLKKDTLAVATKHSPTYRIMNGSDAVVCSYNRDDILRGLELIIIDHKPSIINYCETNFDAVQELSAKISEQMKKV